MASGEGVNSVFTAENRRWIDANHAPHPARFGLNWVVVRLGRRRNPPDWFKRIAPSSQRRLSWWWRNLGEPDQQRRGV
jgi:hypothetical protein